MSHIVSEPEFNSFCDFFYRRTGISFTEAKRYYVEKRLNERMAQTKAGGFAQYFTQLRGGSGTELEQLINSFTINETFFYREPRQFTALVEDMLPELVAHRPAGQPLRILSLPCATGEEPYSLAMHLMEHWPDLARHEVELLGGDIDTAALAQARAGIYGEEALRRLPPELVPRYFTPLPGGQVRLASIVRHAVRFMHLNIMDATAMRQLQNIDVLFCRNMLIYFDDASRRRTMELVYECLRPGGFVCLGHSESMSRISALFTVRPFHAAIVYQKPLS